MEAYDPKDFLLYALHEYKLPVVSHEGKHVYLDFGYAIEVEGQNLFKLLQNGMVIAPFADVEEMCIFIQQDMALNGAD